MKGNASLIQIWTDFGGEDISMRELECAIKDMKEKETTHKRCLVSSI